MSHWSEAASAASQKFMMWRIVIVVMGGVILGTLISNVVVPPPVNEVQRAVKSLERRVEQQAKRLDGVESHVLRLSDDVNNMKNDNSSKQRTK